jgi:hypothetical protein
MANRITGAPAVRRGVNSAVLALACWSVVRPIGEPAAASGLLLDRMTAFPGDRIATSSIAASSGRVSPDDRITAALIAASPGDQITVSAVTAPRVDRITAWTTTPVPSAPGAAFQAASVQPKWPGGVSPASILPGAGNGGGNGGNEGSF